MCDGSVLVLVYTVKVTGRHQPCATVIQHIMTAEKRAIVIKYVTRKESLRIDVKIK